MSALCGILDHTGGQVTVEQLDAMLDEMSCFGGDGRGAWADERIGLGHLMQVTTPESQNDRLPSAAAACLDLDGRLLRITADCRIDNRTELCDRLAIPAAERSTLADSALVLAAYARWGEECPEALLGDFAFAIWDGDRHSLFCARDHMGVRAFYYAQQRDRFLFATAWQAILRLLPQPPTINEPYVKGLMQHNLFYHHSQTLFNEVLALPPGHSLMLAPGGLRRRCYWEPRGGSEIRLPSDEAYAEMAADLLQQAVACRLRSAFPIGVHLSGGMDSSAVAVIAARQLRARGERPTAFSWSPPPTADDYLPDDERRAIEAICAREDLTCYYAQASVEKRLAILDQGVELFARFPVAPTLENAAVALQKGIRVMLTGWGGDETISFGSRGYLLELVHMRQWRTFLHELIGQARHKQRSSLRLLYQVCRGLLRPQWQQPPQRWPTLATTRFHPAFVARMRKVKELQRPPLPRWGQAAFQHAVLSGGHHTARAVAWTDLTADYNLEWRHPFLDRRIIEFSQSIPARLYHTDGQPRYLFNLAMKGILPPQMLWRNNKLEPARIAQTMRNGLIARRRFVAQRRRRAQSAYPLVRPEALAAFADPNAVSTEPPERATFLQLLRALQIEQILEEHSAVAPALPCKLR